LRGQTKTAGGVFAVGYAGIDPVLLADERDTTLEGVTPRGTDDVPDE
jgi:hypothetical protein